MAETDPLTRDIATRLAVSLSRLDDPAREAALQAAASRMLTTMLDDGVPMLDAAQFVGQVAATAMVRLKHIPRGFAGSA